MIQSDCKMVAEILAKLADEYSDCGEASKLLMRSSTDIAKMSSENSISIVKMAQFLKEDETAKAI